MVRGLDYNVMVFVCVKVLNIVGESELSDEVLLLMERGIWIVIVLRYDDVENWFIMYKNFIKEWKIFFW